MPSILAKIKWRNRHMERAKNEASFSEDTSTKVGAVAIGEDNEVLSTGFNGLPRGVINLPSRNERPRKYDYFEHAERNLIYNAARTGSKLKGSTMYITAFPCVDCARAIIQAGIKKVYCLRNADLESRWKTSMDVATEMFEESGVEVISLGFTEQAVPRS